MSPSVTVPRGSVTFVGEDALGDALVRPTPLDARGWTKPTVVAIVANPKYTGYMVYGRTRKTLVVRESRDTRSVT